MSEIPATRESARALRDQARAGGLLFEAYLPGSFADWLLGYVEQGRVTDRSEAIFVTVGLFPDLEPHQELRDRLLRRMIQATVDDQPSSRPADEVFDSLKRKYTGSLSTPARWKKNGE